MIDEFAKVLIERLEEEKFGCIVAKDYKPEVVELNDVIEIANKLAEEYKCENGFLVGKEYVEKFGTCPMCIDCPDGCILDKQVADAKEESNNGWIPCENELPKEYTDVLGCDYNGNIYVLQLYKDSIFGNIWRQWNGGLLRLDVIVAWQPLPAPYKPKE